MNKYKIVSSTSHDRAIRTVGWFDARARKVKGFSLRAIHRSWIRKAMGFINERRLNRRMTTIFPLLRTGWTPSICEVTDSEFQKLLTDYRSFEEKVGRVMQRICEPFCRVCPTPCCRVDICREAAESPFLLAVHGATQRFDPKKGYLGCTGCRLKAGRPPVCHAFVCDKIFKAQPGDERKYALDCLSDLVGFVGKKVSQGRQMVEAMSETHLRASNLPLFQNRLSTATAALTALDSYFTRGDALGEVGMALLGKIRVSPITFRRA